MDSFNNNKRYTFNTPDVEFELEHPDDSFDDDVMSGESTLLGQGFEQMMSGCAHLMTELRIDCLGYKGTHFDFLFIMFKAFDNFSRCRTMRDFFFPISTLLCELTCKSPSEVACLFLPYVRQLFSLIFDKLKVTSMGLFEAQSETPFLYQIREFFKKKNLIIESEFGKRLSAFCSLIICLPVFKNMGIDATSFGFSHVIQKRLSKEYDKKHTYTLWEMITDNTIFFIEKMLTVYETGSLSCIVYDDSLIAKFDEDYAIMSHYYERMEIVENSGMSLDEFYRRADALLDQCDKFQRNYKEDKALQKLLSQRKMFLMRCKLKASDRLNAEKERKPPMAFCLYGGPGIGKTNFGDKMMVMAYQNEQIIGIGNKDFDVKLKYVFSQNDKFYSGFRVSHEVMIIDDVDQFNNKILESQQGGGIAATIDLCNEVMYVTAQADLPNKGMIPWLCKYLIVTSNDRTAGIQHVFKKQSGAMRRFIFIDLEVKPEYKQAHSDMLAGTGSAEDHDFYYIRLRRYVAVTGSYREEFYDYARDKWTEYNQCISPIMEMPEFQIALRRLQERHFVRESTTKESYEKFRKTRICEKCMVNASICFCTKLEQPPLLEAQSLFFEKPTLFQYFYMMFSLWWNMSDKMKWMTLKLVFDEVKWRYFNRTQKMLDTIKKKKKSLFSKFNVSVFIAALVALRGMSYLYSLYKSSIDTREYEGQGSNQTKDSNPWAVSFQDVSRITGVPSTITLEQLTKVVEFNTCHLRLYIDGASPVYQKAFGICGNTVVLPAHFPFKDVQFVDIIRHDLRSPIGPSCWRIPVDDFCYSKLEGTDVAILTHPSFGCFRDIRKFLLDKMIDGKCTGSVCYRNEDGVFTHHPIYMIKQQPELRYHYNGEHYRFPGYLANIGLETSKGDCGSPYLVQTLNGCFIAGFHVAGLRDHKLNLGMCIPLYKHYFNGNKLASFGGVDLNYFYKTTSPIGFKAQCTVPSVIKEMKGTAVILGQLDTFNPKIKSDVRETVMCKDILDHYGMFEPAYTSPKGVSYRAALKLNIEPILQEINVPYRLLRKAQNALFEWYAFKIDDLGIKIPSEPFDRFVGINGLDGHPYINRLPSNTSGGFMHRGRKDKYFIEVDPDDRHSLKYDFAPDIMLEYQHILEAYRRGERANVVWKFCFKDEPISLAKHAENKVRIFSAGPLAFMVLFRQYFLWFVDICYGKYRHHFGMACGANAMGRDWDVLYKYITRHGTNRVIAGDYKKFDKIARALVLTIFYSVPIKLMHKYGWAKHHIEVAMMLIGEITHPMVDVFGILVMFFGCHQSGQPLTTPGNGGINILYIMCACMQICEDEGLDEPNWSKFYDYVSILTYGDDNIMSSSVDEFNHTSISNALAKWGITYTMADKQSESRPFIHISEADFLKRRFVPHVNRRGSIAAPLDEESIIKSLTIATYMKNITFEEQCAYIIESASREYYMYGKSKFEEKREFLQGILVKYNLSAFLPRGRLLTYVEIQNMYDNYEVFGSTTEIEFEAQSQNIPRYTIDTRSLVLAKINVVEARLIILGYDVITLRGFGEVEDIDILDSMRLRSYLNYLEFLLNMHIEGTEIPMYHQPDLESFLELEDENTN